MEDLRKWSIKRHDRAARMLLLLLASVVCVAGAAVITLFLRGETTIAISFLLAGTALWLALYLFGRIPEGWR